MSSVKFLILLCYVLSFNLCAEVVLKLGKQQSVKELLQMHGVENLESTQDQVGNLRKVLFHNKLSMKSAKKLKAGDEIKIPAELEHYFDLKQYKDLKNKKEDEL